MTDLIGTDQILKIYYFFGILDLILDKKNYISVNGSEAGDNEAELIRIQMNGHSDSNSINSRASSSRISSSRVSSHSRAADVEDEGQASPTKKRPMSAKKRSVRIVDGHTSMEESSTNQNGDTNDGLTNQNGDIQGMQLFMYIRF